MNVTASPRSTDPSSPTLLPIRPQAHQLARYVADPRRQHLPFLPLMGWLQEDDEQQEESEGEGHSKLSLSGKNVVLTGALTTRRADVVELLKQAGAHIGTGVSRNTDILVAGDKVMHRFFLSNCTSAQSNLICVVCGSSQEVSSRKLKPSVLPFGKKNRQVELPARPSLSFLLKPG